MGDVMAAYRWENGMVMVFGFDGQQIPELQGKWTDELEQKIRNRSRSDTVLHGFRGKPCVWKCGPDDDDFDGDLDDDDPDATPLTVGDTGDPVAVEKS